VNLPSLGPGAKSPRLGVSIVRGIPKMDDLFHGKSQSQMDDLKVPPLKWTPPYELFEVIPCKIPWKI
jgi:hypothetical protein